MKKIISVLISVCITVAMFATSVSASEDKEFLPDNGEFTSQGYVYNIGSRASCGSDLTGIRPAFYLEDEFRIQVVDGSVASPYILSASDEILIYNESDLKQVTTGKNYKLMADIELSQPWTPLETYSGIFDGNGHTISGMTMHLSWYGSNFGLFYSIEDATIKNLTVSGNVNLHARSNITYVGLITAEAKKSSIINCVTEGTMQTNEKCSGASGGICGRMQEGTIEGCVNKCTIAADYNCGGIVGMVCDYGIVSKCANLADVYALAFSGGVAGDVHGCIEQCYNSGDVVATAPNGGDAMGGIVANMSGHFYDCYNTGDVSGYGSVGGIIGSVNECKALNTYNTGKVVGVSSYAPVANDYSEIYYDSSTWFYLTEICDAELNENDKSTSLTTEQMKQKESFPAFDFETVWDINPEINDGYPYLRCFYEEPVEVEFAITSADSGVAGSWFNFDVEFSSMPTNAYLQFDAPDDNWNWISAEYCKNHETFKIPVNDLKEENGKYVGRVSLIVYSAGNRYDDYSRAVRINADFNGTQKQSEAVKFKVTPAPENPNRSFGNLYEQTSEPKEIDTYPQILSVLVQKTDGQYLLEVSSYIAEDMDNVFFYWETDKGEFTGTSTKYDVAKLNAPEGATVKVTMGDGYGYISTKTIVLPAIK